MVVARFFKKWQSVPAGTFILIAICCSLVGNFYPPLLMAAGVLFWLGSLKQYKKINGRNARQSILLVTLGAALTFIALSANHSINLLLLLQGNVSIVAMLAGVSFLTVISQPKIGEKESLPKGKRSIVSTFLGVHLFGVVINISSVFIHADRMSAHRPLSKEQVVVLTRGFSSGAFWSPFFAAMGVALHYAPDAQLAMLMAIGGGLTVLAMTYTFFEIKRTVTRQPFYGYPLRISSLWLPSLLALIVFVLHYLFAQLSILFIITLCSPLICVIFLSSKAEGKVRFKQHIENKLSNMQNEVVLFLSAGVFAFGLKVLLASQSQFSLFDTFDAMTASLCFLLMIVLSLVGFHMLIGISVVAPLVLPLNPDPSLLAFIILASWSIGAAVGPLSGLNISIQGLYGISSQKILRWNFLYACLMSSVVIVLIFVLDKWLLL